MNTAIHYFLLTLIGMNLSTKLIFDFSNTADMTSWSVVDDVVMGGRSQGNFKLNSAGNALFYGKISLENNGGFSSVRYRTNAIEVAGYSKIVLEIKGDGKDYQLRVKDMYRNYYSYIKSFSTNSEWQVVEIPLSKMYPAFRGRVLQMENFSSHQIEEIAILISNKKNESFKLEIDKIYLK